MIIPLPQLSSARKTQQHQKESENEKEVALRKRRHETSNLKPTFTVDCNRKQQLVEVVHSTHSHVQPDSVSEKGPTRQSLLTRFT